ncbi:MAG: hypothetical protein ACYCY2_09850 [Acidithiobacillus ferriphilus]
METHDTATIIKHYDHFILPVRLVSPEHTITCWLPLNNTEPANKATKLGNKLKYRLAQQGRGGYYQLNGGESVHVYFCRQRLPNKEIPQDRWAYHMSHLCHHWWCCNPDHVVCEPDWVNIFRKRCVLNESGCDCSDLHHPRYGTPFQQCIWYNSHTMTAQHMNEVDFLDEDFLRLSLSDRQRITERVDPHIHIKQLLHYCCVAFPLLFEHTGL